MKKLIEIKNNKPRLIRIQYDIGNLCNYKCWYCFPHANTGTVPFPDVNIVKHNIVTLINYYKNSGLIDEVQLNLMGGEPTLWRDLGEFVQHVAEQTGCHISMQTNGSRTLRWWKEYGKYFNHVSISVHHERAEVDHVSKVADILVDQKVSILTTVLMDHTAWDKCVDIVNELLETKTKFMVLAKPIHINGVVTYTDEQREYLKESCKRRPSWRLIIRHLTKYSKIPKYTAVFSNGEKENVKSDHYFILNMMNRFAGWSCSIGINFLSINREGWLTGTCGQTLFGLDFKYNINDTDFTEKFNPTLQYSTCEQKMCLCAGETVINKKAPVVELVDTQR